MFGDGSDGILNVTSGVHNLNLDHKYQFESVNVAAGATLSTSSTTGAVLYVTAVTEIKIDGTVDVSNKVNHGNNNWNVTIDGVTYWTPGVPNASFYSGQSNANSGFGGGGESFAYIYNGTTYSGGSGGTGGASPNGGNSRSVSRGSNGTSYSVANGSQSGGASGLAFVYLRKTGGSGSVYATSGNGGESFGANGGTGSGGIDSGLFGEYTWFAGGAGGAGGRAGRAGVHVVLRAPSVIINGSVITSGTAGGDGGDGGRNRDWSGWLGSWAFPGLGGAGGNGGDIQIRYAHTLTTTSATLTRQGGAGGAAGYGGTNNTYHPENSSSGSSGSYATSQITDPSQYARAVYPLGITSTVSVGQPNVLVAPLYVAPQAITLSGTIGSPKVVMTATGMGGITSTSSVSEPTITQGDPPPPPPTDWSVIGKEDKKVYVYRVYRSDGTYVGTWSDVDDDPEFTQHINSPGTTMTVQLARSANNMKETRSVRVTEDGHERITASGNKRINLSMTPNAVGEGTDVELNYNVDVYAHYGEFRTRITETQRVRVTEDGHVRVVAAGAPQGVRIFSGFILDYDSEYAADNQGVTVTLASHGWELSNQLIKDGSKTSVTFASQPIETTAKAILDTNPGTMTYDEASIATTGVSVPAKFQLNTKLEGIEYLVEQADSGWYWFGHVGENNVYIRPVSVEPDHIFVKGKHIKSLRLKRSMESLVNDVYFVGGEVIKGDPSSVLYRRYTNSTSISTWRTGLHRKTDRRYTLATSTERYADKLLDEKSAPGFTTPLTISSARYNIESIYLGQTVAFRNFGNFIDDVVLQIVSLSYTPTAVTVELGTLLERQVETLSKLEESLDNEQYENIPDTPS